MIDTISIHIRFGVDTVLGLYQDTLVFSEIEWAARDQKAIDSRKQELADAWVTFRTAQIADEEALRTKEGKQARIVDLDTKIADISAEKARLQSELDTAGPAIRGS